MMKIRTLNEPKDGENEASAPSEDEIPRGVPISPDSLPPAKHNQLKVYYKSGKATAVAICNSRVRLYLYLYIGLLFVEAFYIFLFRDDFNLGWGPITLLIVITPLALYQVVFDIPYAIASEIEGFAVYDERHPQYQPIAVDENDIELYSNSNLTMAAVLFLIGLQWLIYLCVYTGQKDTAGANVIRTFATLIITASGILFLIILFIKDLDDIIKEREDLPFFKRFYFPILYGITSK